MKFPEFMSSRDNTAYNPWVVKYQKAITDNNLDEAKVLDTVKKGLFEGDYHKQKDILIKGLREGGKTTNKEGKTEYALTQAEATRIVVQILK